MKIISIFFKCILRWDTFQTRIFGCRAFYFAYLHTCKWKTYFGLSSFSFFPAVEPIYTKFERMVAHDTETPQFYHQKILFPRLITSAINFIIPGTGSVPTFVFPLFCLSTSYWRKSVFSWNPGVIQKVIRTDHFLSPTLRATSPLC